MNPGQKTRWRNPGWPQPYARMAGALYLVVICGGTFAELFVRARLVVEGNAAATAQNILAHELLYRIAFSVELLYCLCNVPLILILNNLFKVVSRNVALCMVILAFTANAIESISLLAHFAPLVLLNGDHYLNAFSTEQLQAAAMLSIRLFEHGFALSLVFFGFDCFALAYLIINSSFIPRAIGWLLAIEGAGYLINSFSLFLAPSLQAVIFPFFSATALAEVALCLWLLVMGVNAERWMEQSRTGAFARCLTEKML